MNQETRKYRPSNGTEGMLFQENFCFKCKINEDCEILAKTWVYDVNDDEYPNEWIYNENGKPICTDFEPFEEDK